MRHADVDSGIVEVGALLDMQLDKGSELLHRALGHGHFRAHATEKVHALGDAAAAVGDKVELVRGKLFVLAALPKSASSSATNTISSNRSPHVYRDFFVCRGRCAQDDSLALAGRSCAARVKDSFLVS